MQGELGSRSHEQQWRLTVEGRRGATQLLVLADGPRQGAALGYGPVGRLRNLYPAPHSLRLSCKNVFGPPGLGPPGDEGPLSTSTARPVPRVC